MKPTAKYQCDCVEKAIALLEEHNTAFNTLFEISTGEVFLQLEVCKINKKKRGKPKSLIVGHNYCPFCGEAVLSKNLTSDP